MTTVCNRICIDSSVTTLQYHELYRHRQGLLKSLQMNMGVDKACLICKIISVIYFLRNKLSIPKHKFLVMKTIFQI